MTILIIRIRQLESAATVLALAMLSSFPVLAQEDANESPHWSSSGCVACHAEAAPVKGAIKLKAENAEALCESCHGSRGNALPCRHSSSISVGSVTIAESLQSSLENDQVVCTTCHDIIHQCERPKPHFSLQNRGFLRDRTSHYAEDYCHKCHAESAYSALNPHKGVAGDPPRATCPLCHVNIPESDGTGQIGVSFNMQHDLNDACQGCHDTRPHPKSLFSYSVESWVHLVSPSSEVLSNMRESQTETGIELPLDPQTGEIFCATCHDPHEFKGGPVAEQTEHSLRVDNICEACHEK